MPMNLRSPTPRQLEQLFQGLEDDCLSAGDRSWLMGLLRERQEVRDAYHEHMALVFGLRELAESRASGTGETVRRASRIRRSPLLAIAASIACLLVAVGLMALFGGGPPVAVTAGVGTVWEFENGGVRKREFLPGTKIRVDQGTLEILTRNRTKMLLEGPAAIEIRDSRHVRLSSGKGWFDVAAKDKGFTVSTGRQQVVDLGTRFGVSASDVSDRVQVESGLVRLEPHFSAASPTDLRSGQAADVDSTGKARNVDYDPILFLRELPAKPVAIHWSFDEEGADGFPAEATGFDPAPMRVSGFGSDPVKARMTPGRFGSGLDLSVGDSFGVSDFPGISGSAPRTVALWIKDRPIEREKMNHTPRLVSWGDVSIPGGEWSVRIHCATGILGTQWADAGWITAGKFGSRNIHDGQWHHVASVFTGQQDESGKFEVRHYIDGERVETTRLVAGRSIDTRCGGSVPGLRLAYDEASGSGRGDAPVMVDELYVIRAALSDEQIATLFRENRVAMEK